jgi:hypothetical protein
LLTVSHAGMAHILASKRPTKQAKGQLVSLFDNFLAGCLE